MRVLVCGGRDYGNRERLFSVLDYVHHQTPITLIIHGKASGADSLADEWAKSRNVKWLAFPADWAHEGRAAGPLRNQRMLEVGRPEMVIAFPGGEGTADMVRRAEKRIGVKVTQLGPDNDNEVEG